MRWAATGRYRAFARYRPAAAIPVAALLSTGFDKTDGALGGADGAIDMVNDPAAQPARLGIVLLLGDVVPGLAQELHRMVQAAGAVEVGVGRRTELEVLAILGG